MTTNQRSKPASLNIAVLAGPAVQLLDLSPIDLFAMLGKRYISECNLPAPLTALAIENVNIDYIAERAPEAKDNKTSVQFNPTTADVLFKVTKYLDNPSVQPGRLDIVMIPGPAPDHVPSNATKAFLQAHAKSGKTTILSICTGIIIAGHSGILDGRRATGPRGLLPGLKKQFPKVRWEEKRWVVDPAEPSAGQGELWTAAGISNGLDMVATYIQTKMPRELGDLVCGFADVSPRGQDYDNSSSAETSWWLWLIVRSWWKGGKK